MRQEGWVQVLYLQRGGAGRGHNTELDALYPIGEQYLVREQGRSEPYTA